MKFIHKFKPSTLIACAALFFAITGGATAAQVSGVVNLKGLIVHTSNLGNGSVTKPKLAQHSVGVNQLTSYVQSKLGTNEITVGTTGATGAKGAQGVAGPAGANGATGASGRDGTNGTNGISSPLVYNSYSAATGPDSGDCGQNWATDSFSTTYVVQPQADGSFTVFKQVHGTFLTIAGVAEPNDCSVNQTGGLLGDFNGIETFTVTPADQGDASAGSADFDPTGSCATCSPNTTSGSASEAQNKAFVAAFFPGTDYSLVANSEHFDFVYTNHGQSWTDSDTPRNNEGNITG